MTEDQTQTSPPTETQTGLIRVIDESGVAKDTKEALMKELLPFMADFEVWEKKSKELKVTDVSQTREMKIAKECRLAIRDVRTGSEKRLKYLKEESLRTGKGIDSVKNFIIDKCKSLEQYLSEQEDFAENAEIKRLDILQDERENIIYKFGKDPKFYNLRLMDDNSFNELVAQLEKAVQDKIESDRIAEENRIENERVSKLHKERMALIKPYYQFVGNDPQQENYLGLMSSEQFDTVLSELQEKKRVFDEEQELLRLENERLQSEAAKKDRIQKNFLKLDMKFDGEYFSFNDIVIRLDTLLSLSDDEYTIKFNDVSARISNIKNVEAKKKQDEENVAMEKAATRQRRSTEMKPYLVLIRDYHNMLEMGESEYVKELEGVKIAFENERQASIKQQQDEAAEKNRLRQEADDLRVKNQEALQREAEQNRIANLAASATDKEKLITLSGAIAAFDFPEVESTEAKAVLAGTQELLNKVSNWVIQQADKL